MPPQMSEGWGTAYFQVMVTLLVFAFGVPAVTAQFAVPEDIRRVLFRQTRARTCVALIVTLLATCLGGLSLVFVWGLHPCLQRVPDWKEWLAALSVSLAVVGSVLSWALTIYALSRKKLIAALGRKLFLDLKGGREDGSPISRGLPSRLVTCLRSSLPVLVRERSQSRSRDTRSKPPIVEDLVSLGERSHPGYQKDVVLESMDRVIRKLQFATSYAGYELAGLIRHLPRVVAGPNTHGARRNYESAAVILARARARADARWSSSEDSSALRTSMLDVARAALNQGFGEVTVSLMDSLENDREELLVLGREAIEVGEYGTAIYALDLLSRPSGQAGIPCDEAQHLVALIACFWSGSKPMKRLAANALDRLRSRFAPSAAQCLKQAFQYFYMLADFDLAAAIQNLLDDDERGLREGFAHSQDKT